MQSGDSVGAKERAWMCAGGTTIEDCAVPEALVLCAAGERPVLWMPAGLCASARERAFGWALADLVEQRMGWAGLVRRATCWVRTEVTAA